MGVQVPILLNFKKDFLKHPATIASVFAVVTTLWGIFSYSSSRASVADINRISDSLRIKVNTVEIDKIQDSLSTHSLNDLLILEKIIHLSTAVDRTDRNVQHLLIMQSERYGMSTGSKK